MPCEHRSDSLGRQGRGGPPRCPGALIPGQRHSGAGLQTARRGHGDHQNRAREKRVPSTDATRTQHPLHDVPAEDTQPESGRKEISHPN